ncbi:MAG: hypothetical protein EON48_11750 [Acetobacteraceae bacterium]|nr:MAG: hypothetical protein EON48_11750 [Acetobacteraceae bacterium]
MGERNCVESLGMTFIDGTRIRAHFKAASAEKKWGLTALRTIVVKRLPDDGRPGFSVIELLWSLYAP